jgi:hypothetical protein
MRKVRDQGDAHSASKLVASINGSLRGTDRADGPTYCRGGAQAGTRIGPAFPVARESPGHVAVGVQRRWRRRHNRVACPRLAARKRALDVAIERGMSWEAQRAPGEGRPAHATRNSARNARKFSRDRRLRRDDRDKNFCSRCIRFNFDNALLALSFYRDGCDWTSGKIAMRSPRTEPSQSSLAT